MSPVAKENLALLRPALLGAGLLLAVALLAGSWALTRWGGYQQALQAALQALSAALQERHAAQADAQLLARVGADYQSLGARGVIETFEKFSRIEAIDRFEAALRADAPVERYALERAQPLPEGVVPQLQQLAVVRHSLTFDATPLHEEEFLRLWQRIDEGVGGLRAIEQCNLQRVLDGAASDVTGSAVPRLRARCTLNWYVFSAAADAALLNTQSVTP